MATIIAHSSDIGDGRVQQDRIRISHDNRKIVLCDGHGPFGHDYAQAVCDFQIESEERDLTKLFSQTNEFLQEKLPLKYGGTSCSHVTFDAQMMTIANIGDSTVRYWDSLGMGLTASTDHVPTNLEEFIRISNAGGNCRFDDKLGNRKNGRQSVFEKCDFYFAYNAKGGNYYKNCRKEHAAYFESPCEEWRLAMTRAFGDWNLVPHGLSCSPSLRVVSPPKDNVRSVVIASDGLWDVMQDTHIAEIIRSEEFLNKDAQGAADALVSVALKEGKKLFGNCRDNIAVVVVYLS